MAFVFDDDDDDDDEADEEDDEEDGIQVPCVSRVRVYAADTARGIRRSHA